MASNLRITSIAYEDLVEVIEILGRSSTGTVTFRDQKGRVHTKQRPVEFIFRDLKGPIDIKQCPIELGDKFITTIGSERITEKSIYDDFMFE